MYATSVMSYVYVTVMEGDIKDKKKFKNKERKFLQRVKRVHCQCRLCKGNVALTGRVAEKHLRLYGPKVCDDDSAESTSSLSDHESTVDLTREYSVPSPCPYYEESHDYSDYSTSDEECIETEQTSRSSVADTVNFALAKDVDKDKETCYEEALYDTERTKKLLYPNSDQTVLQTLCHYFSWFSEHPGISKSSLSDLLSVQHRFILPTNNNLPSTYEDALKFVEPFLLPLETYHVCPNHCVVFRDSTHFKYKHLTKCPECGSPRYFGNKQPRNRFHY